ncbi:MAG: PhzF family phenazine biosynthesis protein [Planctomycetota bacterium]
MTTKPTPSDDLACVDAFVDGPFSGNPAAVCVCDMPPRDSAWMQAVAAEMNLSETAFVWPIEPSVFGLRWFTPGAEVELCGHATLASAHRLWELGRALRGQPIRFQTRFSGELICSPAGGASGGIEMDFPADPVRPADPPKGLIETLGLPGGAGDATACFRATYDWLVVLRSADAVRQAAPDFGALARFDVRGVCITAESDREGVDIESRFFAPRLRVAEDPVTGSLHCALAELWAPKLGRDRLTARQSSERGGLLGVLRKPRPDGGPGRVTLSGHAATVWQGRWVSPRSG